jgi:hypothetical protein
VDQPLTIVLVGLIALSVGIIAATMLYEHWWGTYRAGAERALAGELEPVCGWAAVAPEVAWTRREFARIAGELGRDKELMDQIRDAEEEATR